MFPDLGGLGLGVTIRHDGVQDPAAFCKRRRADMLKAESEVKDG